MHTRGHLMQSRVHCSFKLHWWGTPFLINFVEEVLSDNHAVWWSPDGSKLLYASFNDTLVKDFSFPIYGPMEHVYTTITNIPYPKVSKWSCDLHYLSCDWHMTFVTNTVGYLQSHSGPLHCRSRWWSSNSHISGPTSESWCRVSGSWLIFVLVQACWALHGQDR